MAARYHAVEVGGAMYLGRVRLAGRTVVRYAALMGGNVGYLRGL